MQQITQEQLDDMLEKNDRSVFSWLSSADRRDNFLANNGTKASSTVVAAYWKRILTVGKPLMTVLNYGSGIGTYAATLRRLDEQRAIRFVGMDFDSRCVSQCRNRFGKRFQFYYCDPLRVPNLPRRFDYILVSQTLSYVPAYRNLLAGLWNKCDGGLLILNDGVFNEGEEDSYWINEQRSTFQVEVSGPKLQSLCEGFCDHVSGITVLSDNGSEREQLLLLRTSEDVPDLQDLEIFSDNPRLFPLYTNAF